MFTNTKTVKTEAFLNLEAMHNFISPKFIIRNQLLSKKLLHSITVSNANNFKNYDGMIKKYVRLVLRIEKKAIMKWIYITRIRSEDIILSMT